MSTIDSSTGGYLAPSFLGGGENDQGLRRVLQPAISGITGIDGTLVRPRWQKDPPSLPDDTVTWAAIGSVHREGPGMPYIEHVPGDDDTSQDLAVRTENLTVMCTFYGPDSETFAEALCVGLWISQNREQLTLKGYSLVDVRGPIIVPEKVNEKWLYGSNVEVSLRRTQGYFYKVRDLVSAEVETNTEVFTDTIDVEQTEE